MSESAENGKFLDAQQIIFLPKWARISIAVLLGLLAVAAFISAIAFLFFPGSKDLVVPMMSIAQTTAGGFALVLFVLFSEKQLSTARLYEKTNDFLDTHLVESLSRIEIPQVEKGKTVTVTPLVRDSGIHGKRKDIYGSNYELQLGTFKMRMWVGINVKRLSVIYFVKVNESDSVEHLEDVFKFTFSGAQKVGYNTNFEHVSIEGEHLVSIWSTVFATDAILGHPTEQLFWVQDIAMMTQSVARTAVRNNINLNTNVEPGPL